MAGLLNRLLPDVWVHTDHNAGRTGGESPGFALSLVAESTTGVQLVAEIAAEKVRKTIPCLNKPVRNYTDVNCHDCMIFPYIVLPYLIIRHLS